MNAIFGMLFLLLTLLRQSMGLLPLRQQTAELCTKNLLVPQITPTRIAREGHVGTCAELSPERSWFRLLANGWPVPLLAFTRTSFASLAAFAAFAFATPAMPLLGLRG